MNGFYVSNHFTKRLKERLNIPKKSSLRFFHKAIEEGIRVGDTTDSKLREYVMSTVYDGYYGIIYSRHLLIISDETNVAITVVDVPKRYWKTINKLTNKGEKHYDTRQRKKSKRELQNEWFGYCLDERQSADF